MYRSTQNNIKKKNFEKLQHGWNFPTAICYKISNWMKDMKKGINT